MGGIRGSNLTGVAATAIIIKDGGWGAVPGGHVFAGLIDVYHLAVCQECGDMVMPFPTADRRDSWASQHPHDVLVGVELRTR
jgi:hypothetical protein